MFSQEFFDLVQSEIEEGYITERHHDTEPYRILNYSPKAQYDRRWNVATMRCRGLILDYDNNVVALPFKKFFNYEEYPEQIPLDFSFDVYEKMDGSLGISYFTRDGLPQIATRGSFNSDQALFATRLLLTQYEESAALLDTGFTYLFEIIYPGNRVVVNYGDKEELVLLAVIDKKTGEEQDLDDFFYLGFPLAPKWDIKDIEEVLSSEIQRDNMEGFVLVFEDGHRVKVKFEEYKRIHRIVCGLNEKRIWEMLRDGESVEQYADLIPDEFYQWAKNVEQSIRIGFINTFDNVMAEFMEKPDTLDRKELAEYFKTCQHTPALFSLLDDKENNAEEYVWKLIKPKVVTQYEVV